MKTPVLIFVERGSVTHVYSEGEKVNVEVWDLDTDGDRSEQGRHLLAHLERTGHLEKVWPAGL